MDIHNHRTGFGRTTAIAALIALVLLAVVLFGIFHFGNSMIVRDRGQLGVTVDSKGQPVIAVMTCLRATPLVDLAEGRKATDPSDKPNVERGSWRARTAFRGVRLLDIEGAETDWDSTGVRPVALEPDRVFIAAGQIVEDKDANLTQVSFMGRDLAGLSPKKVIVQEGTIESIAKFMAYQCAAD